MKNTFVARIQHNYKTSWIEIIIQLSNKAASSNIADLLNSIFDAYLRKMNGSHKKNVIPGNTSLNFSFAQGDFFTRYHSHFITSLIVGNGICLFALLSNILCLIAICTQPRLRRQGNALVANLVVLNILLSLLVYPITIVSPVARQYGNLAGNFCDWVFFYYFTVHAFVWHECLLAFNRFTAIILPHRYKAIATKKFLVFTVIVGYLIPFIVDSYGLRRHPSIFLSILPFGACRFNSNIGTFYPLFETVLGVYLPMCMIGVCYLTIFLTVRIRRRRALSLAREVQRIRIAKMLFVSYLWNTLTYIPQPIMSVILTDRFFTIYPPAFFYIRYPQYLGVAGNVVNMNRQSDLSEFSISDWEPVLTFCCKIILNLTDSHLFLQLIYAMINRDYREGLKTVACRIWRKTVVVPSSSWGCSAATYGATISESPCGDFDDTFLGQKTGYRIITAALVVLFNAQYEGLKVCAPRFCNTLYTLQCYPRIDWLIDCAHSACSCSPFFSPSNQLYLIRFSLNSG